MTDPRPNLIFILADDLGYADLAAPAHAMRTTTPPMSPRLDAMAAQGLRFTRGYSNSPCAAHALALATGRWQYACAARPRSRLPACMATKYRPAARALPRWHRCCAMRPMQRHSSANGIWATRPTLAHANRLRRVLRFSCRRQ
ncbi:sulfatase-like hydrolase/transferase [Staphylococcus epidermidis]|nr:sulfatase-like hydrolase/transferase [Staphylococcus epidermidis]